MVTRETNVCDVDPGNISQPPTKNIGPYAYGFRLPNFTSWDSAILTAVSEIRCDQSPCKIFLAAPSPFLRIHIRPLRLARLGERLDLSFPSGCQTGFGVFVKLRRTRLMILMIAENNDFS